MKTPRKPGRFGMMYSKCREIDRIVRALVAAGWTFRRGGKHGRLRSPEGTTALTVPVTPSDHRSSANFRSQVRRAKAQRSLPRHRDGQHDTARAAS